MDFYLIRLNFFVLLCLLLGSGAVYAQGEGENKKKTPPEHKLDTIIVTGGKANQKQQEVPMSITALTDKDVKDAEIQSIRELDAYVPNLQIVERGSRYNTFYSIRGLGSTFFDETSVGSGRHVKLFSANPMNTGTKGWK